MVMRMAIIWLAFAAFYLLLAGDVSPVELVAGVACASAATSLGIGLSHIAHRRFAGWPSPRAIFRPLAALIPETFVVGRQLVAAIFVFRDQRGAYVRQPFAPGGDDAVSAGRRAAVVLGISLAPGSFVIRGDRTDTMILHALPEKSPSSDRVWPA